MPDMDDMAVILLGHGSRVPGASTGMEEVARRLRGLGRYMAVETCYMERLGPHLPDAMDVCVKSGAKRVIVIPYFLHMGLHTRVDIPNMMRREADKRPDVAMIFGRNLGFDELILELVKKRIDESSGLDDVRNIETEGRERYPLPPDTHVFAPMGHDASNPEISDHGHYHRHGH